MDLSYCEDYWDAPELKEEYRRFLAGLFGLDLSLWDRLGFWDARYRPFSYFHGGTLVSNVCVYSLDMIVRGTRRRVAQISAVGTLPEFRRRGLSRQLLQTAVAWARRDHDFFFLFADAEAFPLYASCGFRPAAEYKARVFLPGLRARSGAVPLDPQDPEHLALLYRLAAARTPVSDELGVLNARLFMYHCLYGLRRYILYLPDLGAAVLARRAGGILTVFDIVAPSMRPFEDIYRYLGAADGETVEFLFMTDKLHLGDVDLVEVEGNGTHVMGDLPFAGAPFIFPYTSQA